MRIKAYAAFSPSSSLDYFEYEKQINPRDILVKINYCSFTRGDVRFIENYWKDTKYPFVPGLEIIGTVEAIGSEVSGLQKEEIVGIGYQVGACFSCEYCNTGKEQFCLKQKLIPIHNYGGFAERIIVDARFAFKMPENLQTAASTPLLCSGLTTYTAIKKCNMQENMRVGVVGIGSLGHIAIQFLIAMGCSVDAFSHSKEKKPALERLGVSKLILSDDQSELEKYKRQYDFIISTSSASLPWRNYIEILKPEGTLCFVGLPPEPISFKAELLADFAQRSIVGNYIGSRKDMYEMLNFASKNNIQALTQVFPIQEVNEVFNKMKKTESPFSVVLQS